MSITARERLRDILMWLLAAIFLAAGIIHLGHPAPFIRITPDWVPYKPAVIAITGLCEIAGAVAFPVPRLRRLAGSLFALYAVCVYPANVKHAIDTLSGAMPGPGWAYHGPRLLFQPVIVWWALFAGRVIDWPLRRRLR